MSSDLFYRCQQAQRKAKMDRELHEFALFLHHQTDHAFLVSESGMKEDAVWIPKSQCEDIDIMLTGEAPEITFYIPEWLAVDKGLL